MKNGGVKLLVYKSSVVLEFALFIMNRSNVNLKFCESICFDFFPSSKFRRRQLVAKFQKQKLYERKVND